MHDSERTTGSPPSSTQPSSTPPSPPEPAVAPQLTVTEARNLAESALGARVDELTPQAGSVGNQNFRLDTDRGPFALKLAAESELAAERWGLERAAEVDVPVPRVAAAGPVAEGRGFLITEWLDGRAARPETDARALVEAGRALRRFHQVTGPGFGRVDVDAGSARGRHGSWADFIDGILAGTADLVRHDVIAASVADRLLAAIADHRDLISYPGAGVLLHCDLKPAHLFVADGRLAAIIDWGDTSYGDPRWDLARLSHSGDAVLGPVLQGYRSDGEAPESPGLEPGADLDRSIACYRVILRLDALHYELMAGGDWFDVYRATINEWLDSLAPTSRVVSRGLRRRR